MHSSRSYFPDGCFGDPGDHAFYADWFSKHLRAAHELPLPELVGTMTSAYRFLWLRTFDHPICIRVDRTPRRTSLSATCLSGKGGYDPGEVFCSREIVLSDDEWALAERSLSWPLLWLPGASTGVDGSQWVLERVDGIGYEVTMRWSPEVALARAALG